MAQEGIMGWQKRDIRVVQEIQDGTITQKITEGGALGGGAACGGHPQTWGPQNTGARFDNSIKAAESEIEKPSGVK